MPSAIKIAGVEHAISVPISPVVCWEARRFLSDNDGEVRSLSAVIGLCIPSMRPPGLPKWTGDNQAEYGRAMADYLMGVLKLPPSVITKIVTASGVIADMVSRTPSEDEIAVEIKNS